MEMDYVALKSEIDNDPLVLGYKTGGIWKTDQQIADLIGAVPVTPSAGRQIIRDIVETWEILEATVQAEWAALTAAEKQRYQTIVSTGRINPRGTNIRAAFAQMFGAGTTTRTNLLALENRPASRADVLFGESVYVWDVARARAL